MLRFAKIVAFVATADASRSRRFYEGVLGLTLRSDEEHALVFDADGTMLRVQKVGEVPRAQYTIVGWEVSDIRQAMRDLTAKGVDFAKFEGFGQDDLGVWRAPDGTQVAWFKDPDGNILSLTQF
ncbi:MAG TPA: VOC family protein [Thermoplasmata archaeon]|nr:VOC family protein [Thermoplasmata archaeon]